MQYFTFISATTVNRERSATGLGLAMLALDEGDRQSGEQVH